MRKFRTKTSNKRKLILNIFLFLFLLIGVGYSTIFTNLGINGDIILLNYRDLNIKQTSSTDRTAFRSDTYRENIKTITLNDSISAPSNVIESWDISENESGGVMAYIVQNANDNTKYDLYIQGNGRLYSNKDSSYLFYGLTSLETINNLNKLTTTKTTNMSNMFNGDSNLKELDLSNFNMSKVTNTTDMLTGDTKLSKVTTPKVYPSDSSVVITLPFVMYDSQENAYSSLNNTNIRESEIIVTSTFIYGSEFNLVIKRLAGNTNVTELDYIDENIIRIEKSNVLSITPTDDNVVSTPESTVPIYAWYSNNTIYYYSIANKLYINETGNSMFRFLTKLESVDMGITTDSSKTTSLWALFYNAHSIKSIDLSGWDTNNVTVMRHMFCQCRSLENLNLSNWNTENLEIVSGMFSSSGLYNLDISMFDMSNVTATDDFLSGMTSLKQLKTPKAYPSGLSITLPITLYDSNSNSYTALNNTSPTKTWISTLQVNGSYSYNNIGLYEFIAPFNGTYKLETWGAQGGSVEGIVNYDGAYGGYSTGSSNIDSGNILYIVVGGQGTSVANNNVYTINENGYNGGGNNSYQDSPCYYGSGGGGATHIATNKIESGLLSEYSNNINKLLIVAGGGGGSSSYSNPTCNTNTYGRGGSGGGSIGSSGTTDYTGTDTRTPGTGGTQNSIGISSSNVSTYADAMFGRGCIPNTSYTSYMRVAGGGGLYGGGCGIHSGGGGGSGYIANSMLTNKAMYCYDCTESLNNSTESEKNIFTVSTTGTSSYRDTTNCPDGYSSNAISKCAKAGNGYTRITLISINN